MGLFKNLFTRSKQTTEKHKVRPKGVHLEGDTLRFGRWEQPIKEEPIDWIVLKKEDEKALVITRDVISWCFYTRVSVDGLSCDEEDPSHHLYRYLQKGFLENAFTEEERAQIDPEKSVFLLSVQEAEQYFKDPSSRQAYIREALKYTESKPGPHTALDLLGYNLSSFYKENTEDEYITLDSYQYYYFPTCWWLQSEDKDSLGAPFVGADGVVEDVERFGLLLPGGLRPAMWVYLCKEDLSAEEIEAPNSVESKQKPRPVLPAGFREGPVERGLHIENNRIYLGSFPMRRDGTAGYIGWDILKRDGDKALVISQCVLDYRPYHWEKKAVTWGKCSLHKWLNEKFLYAAFTEEERSLIEPANGEDYVFILSDDEFRQYFPENDTGSAYPSEYTQANSNDKTQERWMGGYEIHEFYCWHRSPSTTEGINGVRPAMWIHLK